MPARKASSTCSFFMHMDLHSMKYSAGGQSAWLLMLPLMSPLIFFSAFTLAAPPVVCSLQEDAGRSLPDPAVCMQRANVPAGPAAQVVSALFSDAEGHIADGRFDVAGQSLDCANAVLGDKGNPGLQYELIRRRGIIEYRRERIPQALARFECALTLSSANEDRTAIARDLKNVGTALRRLGDYRGALRALTTSLDMQRADGTVAGAVLNNIADVYRQLDEPIDAMRFYREAIEAFRAAGNPIEAAHVLESMGVLALDRGKDDEATRWLEEALQVYREGDHRAYELRVYGALVRASLGQGDIAKARQWSASATAIASEHGLSIPASVQLQMARTERLSGLIDTSLARVRDALRQLADGDALRGPLREELAAIQEAAGDRAAAITTLRLANADALASARAQGDQQLGWLRTRFETAERDRTIAALETDNRLRRSALRQRTLWLWLILAIAAAAAIAAWALLQRRRHRDRIRQEGQRVRHEEELGRYRREADALTEGRGRLQALLDSREDAVCLLDAEGEMLAANRAACRLLAVREQAAIGRAIVDLFAVAGHVGLSSALEKMQDSAAQVIDVVAADNTPLTARLFQWEQGDGLIVMELTERSVQPSSPHASQTVPAQFAAAADGAASDAQMRNEFRRTLVELMLALVDIWERNTGTNRLELAEKSRIWRVNIDDGRLRARAMERYLAVSKLPQNPRWRDVLRSAYFVLGQCTMEPSTREDLQRRVDAVLAYTRRDALV